MGSPYTRSDLGKTLRAFGEATTIVILMLVASIVWAMSPLLALLIALAVVDAFDDLSIVVTGKSIYPTTVWRVLNPIFEIVAFVVALVLIELAFTYMFAFPFPIWYVVLAIAFFIAITSSLDVTPKNKKLRRDTGDWV